MIVDIVVKKPEVCRMGHQIILAPSDHAGMQVKSYIPARPCALLHHLPREPSAAASKIKDRIKLRGVYLQYGIARRILKCSFIRGTNKLGHLERRDWKPVAC